MCRGLCHPPGDKDTYVDERALQLARTVLQIHDRDHGLTLPVDCGPVCRQADDLVQGAVPAPPVDPAAAALARLVEDLHTTGHEPLGLGRCTEACRHADRVLATCG